MEQEQELLARAIAFAADKHKHQTRKDGSPYIYHLFNVAQMLKDAGYGIQYQTAAILHDTLEDTDATPAQIRSFGDEVLNAVMLVTRLPGIPEEVYVSKILQDPIAAAVKNADKIHNVQDAACSSDKQWGIHYIEKAERYYGKRFSRALDDSIAAAKTAIRTGNVEKIIRHYTKEAMMLYSGVDVLP